MTIYVLTGITCINSSRDNKKGKGFPYLSKEHIFFINRTGNWEAARKEQDKRILQINKQILYNKHKQGNIKIL